MACPPCYPRIRNDDGGHGAKRAFAHPTIARKSSTLDLVRHLLCQGLGILEFPFRPEPELEVPSCGLSVLLPDFPRPVADFAFIGMRQGAGPVPQLGRQRQYALDRLPVPHPPRMAAILAGLFDEMADELLLIHPDKTTER